jgi:hypothetical protein
MKGDKNDKFGIIKYLPMKGPTMTAINPKITEYKPNAEGNLSRLYSANTRGNGTWMKLLAKPRNPVMSVTARKPLNTIRTATRKQNQKENIKKLKQCSLWITGFFRRHPSSFDLENTKDHSRPETESVSVLR